jgi:hypothetical protein
MDTADSIADHPVTSGGVVAKRASVGMATQQPLCRSLAMGEAGIQSLQNLQLNAMTCLNATNLRNLQERR